LRVFALPVQETAGRAKRPSSCSTASRVIRRRRSRDGWPREPFGRSRHRLIHWRRINVRIMSVPLGVTFGVLYAHSPFASCFRSRKDCNVCQTHHESRPKTYPRNRCAPGPRRLRDGIARTLSPRITTSPESPTRLSRKTLPANYPSSRHDLGKAVPGKGVPSVAVPCPRQVGHVPRLASTRSPGYDPVVQHKVALSTPGSTPETNATGSSPCAGDAVA
jgi:hypothetical protein